jgi:hypothetical protein
MPMVTKGSWEIMNLKGVMKRFKSAESEEAKAWMNNRDDAVTPKEKKPRKKKEAKAEE